MSFEDDKDGGDGRKSGTGQPRGDDTPKPPAKKKPAPAPEVGQALRSAYQRTLAEDIPPEMLDLLGKLG